MPKLIPDIKEKIFAVAKTYLFKKGYKGLTLREIASDIDVAVGTIYNYFPSKDMLVASIMAEDWLIFLKTIKEDCAVVLSLEQGIKVMYDAIKEYTKIYEPIWQEYKGMPSGFGQRHLILRGQLSDLLVELLGRFGHDQDYKLCPLLAETVLACAMQEDISYSPLSEIIGRLFL